MYNKRDFFIPLILVILFIFSSNYFFHINKGVNFWQNMKLANGNAFKFCEFNDIGNVLVQKSNTWSNIGFLVVGVFIFTLGIKDSFLNKNEQHNLLLKYPVFSIITAISILYLFIGSFFYHASVTSFFQMIDQTGMYAILLSFMGFNVFRLWPTLTFKKKQYSSHNIVVVLITLLNILFIGFLWKININILYTSLAFAYITFTIIYNKKNPSNNFTKKILHYALYTYLVSTFVWVLDRKHIFCDPESIFQGHSLWHLFNAVVLLFLYLHYRSENSLE